MSYYRKWKPSKTKVNDFKEKMNEIDYFCKKHNIHRSQNSDSYYFTINNINYRVSNHAVESRNKYDDFGNLKNARGYKLDDHREKDTVYIHASKTRIIEIYSKLKHGFKLDGRGKIIKKENRK